MSSSSIHLFDKEELIAKFGWEEYFIFALMLSVSAGIGMFFWWRGQQSNAEFLMGGKSMGVLPMTMSLVARYELIDVHITLKLI